MRDRDIAAAHIFALTVLGACIIHKCLHRQDQATNRDTDDETTCKKRPTFIVFVFIFWFTFLFSPLFERQCFQSQTF